MKKLLFATCNPGARFSGFLLGIRLLFGILFMTHGFEKLINYQAMTAVFPDPLGIGSDISLALVIFAEFFCSIAFILGLFFRLSVIPMIFAMGVAFFITHECNIEQGELAFIYLMVFSMLAITGPGIYSADHLINKYCSICNKDKCSTEYAYP